MKTIILLLTTFLLLGCSKKFTEYEHLTNPQISEKSSQHMLVYKAVGDPNEIVGEAFGALFSTFFKLKREYDMDFVAPLARWPKGTDTPRDEWVGIFGIPVSEKIKDLPVEIQAQYPALKLDIWHYGEVAEILHLGSYATENPTVAKLHEFIATSGYEISGFHEEEYLKGPGLLGKGNPDKYYTIIRYPVSKKPMSEMGIEEPDSLEVSKNSFE